MIEQGAMVVVALGSPKEKYWGRLVKLDAVGIQLRGMELRAIHDWAREVAREQGMIGLGTVFFPMSRVEKVFLDEDSGVVPSVSSQILKVLGEERFNQLLG